jgi:DNA-binding NarL/FixJ family response regulator
MEEVARIVLALETPEVAEEVMHFLDRTGRSRVVGTAVDGPQLAEAVRQLEPDVVVAGPTLANAREGLNGSALLVVDTSQSVGALRRAIRAGATGFYLWPAEREELAFAAARTRPARQEGIGAVAPVLAVYGSRGGAGATFVATHLAAAFAERERRCVLVDMDVVFSDVTAAVGVDPDEAVRTIDELAPLADELSSSHLEEILWHHPKGFQVLFAPAEARGGWSGAETYRRRSRPRVRCATSSCSTSRGRWTTWRGSAWRCRTASCSCSVSTSCRSETRSEPSRSRVWATGAPS